MFILLLSNLSSKIVALIKSYSLEREILSISLTILEILLKEYRVPSSSLSNF